MLDLAPATFGTEDGCRRPGPGLLRRAAWIAHRPWSSMRPHGRARTRSRSSLVALAHAGATPAARERRPQVPEVARRTGLERLWNAFPSTWLRRNAFGTP